MPTLTSWSPRAILWTRSWTNLRWWPGGALRGFAIPPVSNTSHGHSKRCFASSVASPSRTAPPVRIGTGVEELCNLSRAGPQWPISSIDTTLPLMSG